MFGYRKAWPYALILLMFWTACSGERQPDPQSANRHAGSTDQQLTIVAMGDSLTAGLGVDLEAAYPALLERQLLEKGHSVRVINAGISGETSSGALSRTEWVLSMNPDVVILETGANDGLRGIDPSLTSSNLDAIIRRFKEEGTVVILAGMKMVPNLGRHYTRAFGQVYPQLAKKHDVALIPFFLQPVAAKARFNQSDGIHPNAAGYEQIVEYILPYILAALP